jgi:hypothetical protein
MTLGELLRALDGVPCAAEVRIVVDGRELDVIDASSSYEGFCDPQYTVRLVGALTVKATHCDG